MCRLVPGLAADLHDFPAVLFDRDRLVQYRPAVAGRRDRVAAGAQPELAHARAPDDDLVAVDPDLDRRVVHLDDQRPLGGPDAEDHAQQCRQTPEQEHGGGRPDPPPPSRPLPSVRGWKGGHRVRRGLLEMGQVPAEQLGDLGGGLEAAGGLLGVELLDDRSQPLGTSGLTSRTGRGASSQTRRSTATVVSARNGERPVHMA